MSQRTAAHVCFIGCGAATRTHARLLRGSKIRLSFASRSLARASAFRTEFHGETAFESYEAAIDHSSVDLIVVATPPALHFETAEAAVRAGKAVALVKPAFPTSGEALFISRLAESERVPVFVLENYAYKPLLRRLRRVLESGWIGRPRFIRVDALKRQRVTGWRAEPSLIGGGPLLEGGIHWVSFMARLGPAVKDAYVIHAGRAGQLSSLLV